MFISVVFLFLKLAWIKSDLIILQCHNPDLSDFLAVIYFIYQQINAFTFQGIRGVYTEGFQY